MILMLSLRLYAVGMNSELGVRPRRYGSRPEARDRWPPVWRATNDR